MVEFKMENGKRIALSDAEQAEHDARILSWPDIKLKQEQVLSATNFLIKSDITILRCKENNIDVPIEWSNYRKSLRTIIKNKGGELPTAPNFPQGT